MIEVKTKFTSDVVARYFPFGLKSISRIRCSGEKEIVFPSFSFQFMPSLLPL
jgi:hypothetical protein